MIDNYHLTNVEEHDRHVARSEQLSEQANRFGEPNPEPLALTEAKQRVEQLKNDFEAMSNLVAKYVTEADAWRAWRGKDNAVSKSWSQLINGYSAARRAIHDELMAATVNMIKTRDDWREKCGLSRLEDLT
jgi:uncharacterized coiled-coil DUF342 family protein